MYELNLKKQLTMIYDGKPLPPYAVVEAVRRPFLFDISTVMTDLPGLKGLAFQHQNYGGRKIEVDVRVVCDTHQSYIENRIRMRELVRSLRLYFYKPTPKELQLSDQPATYDLAIIDDIAAKEKGLSTLITVTFLATEGFSRARKQTYPGYTAGVSTVHYDGDIETPVEILGKVASESAMVWNKTTGDRLNLLHLTTGANLHVDAEHELVEENGKHKMLSVTPESDFPWLAKGKNELEITGISDITLRFERRFL